MSAGYACPGDILIPVVSGTYAGARGFASLRLRLGTEIAMRSMDGARNIVAGKDLTTETVLPVRLSQPAAGGGHERPVSELQTELRPNSQNSPHPSTQDRPQSLATQQTLRGQAVGNG